MKKFKAVSLVALFAVSASTAFASSDAIFDSSVYATESGKIFCMSGGVDKDGNDVVGKAESFSGQANEHELAEMAKRDCFDKGGLNCRTAMCVGI